MLVIICTKYGKNPSRTVDATERTRFSRPRPNDLQDIGQSQRSLYATHPLILVIICAKYGKNPFRTVDFFFQGEGRELKKIAKNIKFADSFKKTYHATHPLMIVIIYGKYKKNPPRFVDSTERTRYSKSRPNDLEDISQGQESPRATHPLMLLIDHLYQIWKECILNYRFYTADTHTHTNVDSGVGIKIYYIVQWTTSLYFWLQNNIGRNSTHTFCNRTSVKLTRSGFALFISNNGKNLLQ